MGLEGLGLRTAVRVAIYSVRLTSARPAPDRALATHLAEPRFSGATPTRAATRRRSSLPSSNSASKVPPRWRKYRYPHAGREQQQNGVMALRGRHVGLGVTEFGLEELDDALDAGRAATCEMRMRWRSR